MSLSQELFQNMDRLRNKKSPVYHTGLLIKLYCKSTQISIKLPNSYSTVTDLARLRGLSTSHSR